MIRTVAACPYCRDGVVALDDRLLEVVFNPDSVTNTPCSHLSFFWVSLSGPRDWDWGRFWEHGRGLSQLADDLLTNLVVEITLDMVPEERPHVSHLVDGATAGPREAKRPGTGEFWVYPPGGSPESIVFDGYGVYAHDAAALVAAMHEKVRKIWIEVDRVN